MSPRCRSSSPSPPGITVTSRPRSRPSSPRSWSPPPRAARWVSWGSSTRAASPRRAITVPAWRGSTTAGSGKETNRRLGKEDNCQVGVFLVGVTPGGAALLDHELYLPEEEWCEDTEACHDRRAKAHIPERLGFRTKPAIAAELIRLTVALGVVALDWITADEGYGRNGDFLDELEALGHRYVVEVPVSTTVWTEDPAGCVPPYGGRGRGPTQPSRASVRSVAAVPLALPPEGWRTLQVRQGAKGPLVFEFAAV